MSPAERAIRALRRGDPVAIGGAAFRAVETAAGPGDRLVLSWERAVVLKLVNQRAAAVGGPGAVAIVGPFDPAQALAIADPTADLASPLRGPFRTITAPPQAQAAVDLARHAELLPAVFWDEGTAAIAISAANIAAYDSSASLRIVSRARLPVSESGTGELAAFRSAGGGPEHIALLLGRPRLDRPVLTRLHSSCLTGDVLGSLRCDCGPQLSAAIHALRFGGILLYLQQEGRGIGLVNKLRAYALQDMGYDTLDANEALGLPQDARDYRLAAAMLEAFGVESVRLLTNNPAKVAALEAAGVTVAERVPLAVGSGPDNARYLETKRLRAGHQF